MDIDTARLIYFSPTRTTRKIVEGMAQGARAAAIRHVDLTPWEADPCDPLDVRDCLAIIGAPVYSGRVPADMITRLRRVKGNGTTAAVVVLYGNRAYEDALLELRDLASDLGFTVIAAGAFVGEHSFSNEKTPIAVGRPDREDMRKAEAFGRMIRDKMGAMRRDVAAPLVAVPGNFPYRQRPAPLEAAPVTQEALCVKCGQCASVCPVAGVCVGDTVTTDKKACIRCCACVKACPSGARSMDAPRIIQIAEWLSTNCRERKEPETYL